MTPAFLGVERSLGGRRWVLRESDERTALALAQRLGLPEVAARVMAARGIGLDEAVAFLNPSLRDALPDPSHLLDMDRAAERLAAAVINGDMIALFGDYDVDGATSSALLARFFAAVGGKSRIHIPDRIKEGYGPNAPALLRLAAEGAKVVVTVDCGTTAFEPLAAAVAAGLDVIVADHHEAEPRLPQVLAVVNPNRLDETSPHRHLAAVGVAFLLAVAVNRTLRAAGWFKTRTEPDLKQWLDLVALGTVCDVVPLIGVNRALVAQGLKVMAGRGNPGLAALADVAKIGEAPSPYHVGYIMGPRVNAGGRVGEAPLGARLLATDDPAEAQVLAKRLDGYNRERQGIEAAVLDEATRMVEAAPPTSVVFAAGQGWHPGVVGIVAGRLKERYDLPAVVIALDGDTGVGSARSIRGIDLGAAILAARQEGLLIRGGGHAMAAGLAIQSQNINALYNFLEARFEHDIAAAKLVPTLKLDGALAAGGANLGLIEALERLGPYGAGNAEPRFVITGARIATADVVGADHVRCILAGPGGARLKAIAFRSVDTDLGKALLAHGGAPFHLAGKLRLDNWQGRAQAQLILDDAARAV